MIRWELASRHLFQIQLGIIEDILAGDIPDELKELWDKHNVPGPTLPQGQRRNAPVSLTVSPF